MASKKRLNPLSSAWNHLTGKAGKTADGKKPSIYERSLDWSKQEIRLLEILPLESSVGGLHFGLRCVSLQDQPDYTALSYVWGQPRKTKAVVINGIEVQVTVNLEAALQEIKASTATTSATGGSSHFTVVNAGTGVGGYLDHEIDNIEMSTLFWIDAVCINQSDGEEKADQVKNMDLIYKKARQVLVWLGEADEHTSVAFSELKMMGSLSMEERIVDYDTVLSMIDGADFDQSIRQVIARTMISRADNWQSVLKLCERSWWRRVWVVQEAILARKACIACGGERMDWQMLSASLTLINLFIIRRRVLDMDGIPGWTQAYDQAIEIYRHINHFISTPNSTGSVKLLFQALSFHQRKRLGATDDRDRVYSILSLLKEPDRSSITVRYDLLWSCIDVYMQATELALRQNGLRMLGYCSSERSELDMPTWVLDWATSETRQGLQISQDAFSVCGTLSIDQPHFQIDHGYRILKAQAIDFDQIVWIGERFIHPLLSVWQNPKLGTRQAAIAHIQLLTAWIKRLKLSIISTSNLYKSPGDIEDALWRTCVQDGNGETLPPGIHEGYKAIMAEFDKNVYDSKQAMLEQQLNDCSLFIHHCAIRDLTPFITVRGYVGLANGKVKNHDVIFILPGLKIPLILRKTKKGLFKIQGNAYVHGIMYGEFTETENAELSWIDIC